MEGIRDERYFIKRALRLAAKALGRTSPNPAVGAVLVRDNRIIAEDYHRGPGRPHAEALVIQEAGEKARGATLYVSLEPCCHTDKRTPPCTKAIIKAGIKKVVAAMRDPNPKVSGRGLKELEASGIEVISGLEESKTRILNEAYVKYITTGRPFVILKAAMTLDGRIATPAGQSKWITGDKARRMVHIIRGRVDAVMTAIGTVKADDPELTVRLPKKINGQGLKNPIRIVIDPRLEIPLNARLLDIPPETIIVSRKAADMKKREALIAKGARLIEFEGKRLDLSWLMESLGEMGLTSIMLEGGSSLNAYALEDGIVDKVMFFIAPKLIGGRESYPVIGGKVFRTLEEAHKLKDTSIRKVGEDFLIEGYMVKGAERSVDD